MRLAGTIKEAPRIPQEEARCKIVTFLPRSEWGGASKIMQEDLVELDYLARLANEARENWEKKRDWIKAALRAGLPVDDGLRTCKLVKRSGKVREYERLVQR